MPDRLFGFVERELSRRGGAAAELSVRRARVRSFTAREGGLDAIAFHDTLSLSLRVFRDGRMGFSYAFGDREEDVRRMVEAALFCAVASDPDDAYRLPSAEDGPVPGTEEEALYDPRCEATEDGEKGEFAREMERTSIGYDARMKRVRAATLRETVARTDLRNSLGVSRSYRESVYVGTVDPVAEDGVEAQTGYGFGMSRALGDLSARKIAEEGASRALRMFGARVPDSGRYAAVLENGATADLLEVLLPSFLAPNVVKGKSMLCGKRGQAIGSPRVTLVDDPFDPGSTGAAPFDGEGIPSRRNSLVRDGILEEFLADTFWGEKLGTGSTGSLRRPSPKVPPSVGASGLRMDPGDRTRKELLSGIGWGILLTELLGVHTADPVSGDFSIGGAGIFIEGGREAGAVRGFAVSGNVLSLLRGVVAAGSDFRWFGATGCPSLAVEPLEIGGT